MIKYSSIMERNRHVERLMNSYSKIGKFRIMGRYRVMDKSIIMDSCSIVVGGGSV